MNSIAESKGFEIRGYWIPPFKLLPGKLIRIYIPNFSRLNEPLGFDLALELVDIFAKRNAVSGLDIEHPITYAKNYQYTFLKDYIFPITIKNYLVKKLKVDIKQANSILSYLLISPSQKLNITGYAEKKIATILGLFTRNQAVIFDYYGMSFLDMEQIGIALKQEIDKGKCAIGFDNLQYIEETEPYENFERIILSEATSR